MALKVLYTNFVGTLATDISDAATLLPLDIDTYTLLTTQVDFGGGDWIYLKLDNGAYSEEVKVTASSSSPNVVIERAKSGSTAMVFNAIDTNVTYVLGEDAITDIASSVVSPPVITIEGDNLVNVSNDGTDFTISVDIPNFISGDGIVITGDWPEYTISIDPTTSGCCGDGSSSSGGGIDTLTISSEILSGNISDTTLVLSLDTPNFSSDGSIEITGVWPNYSFTTSGGGGGSGTVTSVSSGAGISITGTPSINPTVSLTPTGVTAGTYAGVQINTYGQFVAVPTSWSPLTALSFTDSVGSATYSGGTATITLVDADVGQKGVVQLADPSAPLDSSDTTSAVTPKSVLDAIGSSVSDANGTGTGEADGLYTNILSSTATSLVLASGEKAVLIGQVEVLNTSTPLTPEAFGLAVFTASSTKLVATKICTQSNQTIMGVVNGPVSLTTISLVTTTLGGSDTVYSSYLAVIKL